MQHGQLGTEFQPRFIFVWEGALAELPPSHVRKERRARRLGRWERAVALWHFNDLTIRHLWTVMARTTAYSDLVVTSRPEPFAQAVARLIEMQNLPIRYVWCLSAPELGRKLSSMPDVLRVFYGHDEHQFAFGPQGYHLSFDHRGRRPLV